MNTVGENIIATAKIQNKYGAITILEKCPFLKGNKIISHLAIIFSPTVPETLASSC